MRILDRMSIIGHDIIRFRNLQKQALKSVQWENSRQCRKYACRPVDFESEFMLGVERQSHANRDRRIIIGHNRSVLDSQEQASEIATISDYVRTSLNR
jgi:hypothetical protein